MRHVVSASLVVLLAASAAHATVYVWKDREGSLVLTNDADRLGEAPNGPLITYETTESASAPATTAGAEFVAVQPVEVAPAAARASAAGAQEPAADAQEPAAGAQAAPVPVTRAAPAAPVAVAKAAPSTGASARAAPGAPVTPLAGPAGSVAPAAGGAPRTLGEANAQHLIAAATTPTTRGAVDPRALLDVAARAEPPQVIVRIVEPSAGPLSTSDGANSLAGGGMRSARDDLR